MILIRIGLGVVIAAVVACLDMAVAQQPLDITDFVDGLRACKPVPGPIAVAVTDFLDGTGRDTLDPRERENVRAAMERALATQNIRTTAIRDTPLLREWQREGGNKTEMALREALRGAREVDAVIVFEVVRRDSNGLVWRARAFTPDGDCSRASANLSIPTVTAADAFAIQGRFALVARQLFAVSPRPQSIAIMPFDSATGVLGDCDGELPALLDRAIAEEEGDPRNALSDRHIARQVFARVDTPGNRDAIARGAYGADERGRLWVSLQVTNRDGASLVQLPQTFVTGTTCRGVARSLIDHVRETIRNPGSLVVAAPPEPRVGTIARFSIQNKTARPLSILCWSVAQDNTAEILTPLRGSPRRINRQGPMTFPTDFGLALSCFTQPIRELFGCFGYPGEIPPTARELWTKAWPEDRREPVELSRDEVLRLLDAMRSIEGVVEAARPYAVRPGRADPSGYCAVPSGRVR